MWLCKGSDVTSNSEIQHTSSPKRQVQGCVHPPETGSGGWGIDGTTSAMEGLSPPEDRETEASETVRRQEVGTMGYKVGHRKEVATWRGWSISGVK